MRKLLQEVIRAWNGDPVLPKDDSPEATLGTGGVHASCGFTLPEMLDTPDPEIDNFDE